MRAIQQPSLLMSVGIGICRCEKARNRAAVAARDAHNRRAKRVGNADSTKTAENVNLRPDLPPGALVALDAVFSRMGSPVLRKNGTLAIEYVMTFSPEAAKSIEPLEWARRCLSFVEARHQRENVISAYLHMDERTPHVHVMAVPVDGSKVVVGPFMGNRATLRKLQDSFFAGVSSHFDLARNSANPTGRRHLSPAELRALSVSSSEVVATAKKKLRTIADQPVIDFPLPTISLPALLTERGRKEHERRVRLAAVSAVKERQDLVVAQASSIIEDMREIAERSVLLEEEIRIMNASEMRRYRDLDLCAVAQRYLGVSPRKEGGSYVFESDGHKVVITTTKFKDFRCEQGRLGGGAIDLVMHLLRCDFQAAVRALAADFPGEVVDSLRSHHARLAREEGQSALAAPRKVSFAEQLDRFGRPDASKLPVIRRYLREARMLPDVIVDQCIATGDLWANDWGSCVFAHRSAAGEICGCTIRSTFSGGERKAFKQVLGDKTTAWFSAGALLSRAERLVITEAPVDVLSFLALKRAKESDAVVSTAGAASYGGLVALRRPMVLAQDADHDGCQQAEALAALARRAGLRVERCVPERGKDWNEFLTYERDQRIRIDREIAERERQIAGSGQTLLCRDREARAAAPAANIPGDRRAPDSPRGDLLRQHGP